MEDFGGHSFFGQRGDIRIMPLGIFLRPHAIYLNFFSLFLENDPAATQGLQPAVTVAPTATASGVCSKCGQQNTLEDAFCVQCGKKI
jgi:hypothetical protein